MEKWGFITEFHNTDACSRTLPFYNEGMCCIQTRARAHRNADINILFSWHRIFFEKVTVTELVKIFTAFMKSKGSLLFSQTLQCLQLEWENDSRLQMKIHNSY
jgi:hypothetical protein